MPKRDRMGGPKAVAGFSMVNREVALGLEMQWSPLLYSLSTGVPQRVRGIVGDTTFSHCSGVWLGGQNHLTLIYNLTEPCKT